MARCIRGSDYSGVYVRSFSPQWVLVNIVRPTQSFKINNFINTYNSLVNNHTRRSGSSDVNIMTAAHNEYRFYHGRPFTMIPSLELLRKSPRWHLVVLYFQVGYFLSNFVVFLFFKYFVMFYLFY
ncbi:hypothetical protein Hanom_Chr16g01478301 [Helianthus anomalus]